MSEQGSDEWFAERLGKVTASRVADVVAKTRSGPAASRGNYMAELIAERLTGDTADSFTSAPMQWGIDTEPEARSAYEFYRDCDVDLVGFVNHPSIEMCGASPDGLIGKSGLVEIKCPNTKTHIETLRGKAIEKKYITQMQWQMACCDRDWCDFVSYDPRMPENLSMHIERIERDPVRIAELTGEITEYMAELDTAVAELTALAAERKAE